MVYTPEWDAGHHVCTRSQSLEPWGNLDQLVHLQACFWGHGRNAFLGFECMLFAVSDQTCTWTTASQTNNTNDPGQDQFKLNWPITLEMKAHCTRTEGAVALHASVC